MQETMQNKMLKGRFLRAGAVLLLIVCLFFFSACKDKAETPDIPDISDTAGEEENKTEDEKAEDENAEDEKAEDEKAEDEETEKEVLKSFQAVALNGESFTQEDLADRDMTVINFWATTCGPCISEMPDLAEFSEALPDRVQVITVCLDGGGQEDLVKELLEEAGFEGITLLSGDGDFLTLCYAVMYTPTTVFIDSDGRLAGDVIIGGKQDFQAVYLAALNKALQESGKEEVELESDSKS